MYAVVDRHILAEMSSLGYQRCVSFVRCEYIEQGLHISPWHNNIYIIFNIYVMVILHLLVKMPSLDYQRWVSFVHCEVIDHRSLYILLA